MTFRIQDLMIDVLPGTQDRRQPGQLLCGTTSCGKSTPEPLDPTDPTEPDEPACGPSSCGKSTGVYQTAHGDLSALRRQLHATLAGR